MVNQKLNFFHWGPETAPPGSHSEAPTLVFLHGMGGTGQIWRAIAAKLEAHYDCIAPDQRGHGKSRPVSQETETHFHAEDYARDVSALLEHLGIKHYFLIGHSMGVRTALALAKKEPRKVRGLIAVDIGITSEWGGGMGLPLASFIKKLPETFPDRPSLKAYLSTHCPDPAMGNYLAAVALHHSTPEDHWSFPFDHSALIQTIQQAHHAPLKEWLFEILNSQIPVYFLRGEHSKVWSRESFLQQQKEITHPLLTLTEWENCGHGLPFEQRIRFIEFIKTTFK